MEQPTLEEIIMRRKELERELAGMLKRAGSHFGLDDIREAIYNEGSQNDLAKIIPMFDTGQGGVELNDIMETVIDAWNYFPHKALGGIAPVEKSLQYNQKHK